MGMFTNLKLDSLDDLLLVELKDLYDCEHRLTDAIPKMAEAAHDPELKQALNDHLRETQNHISRLDQAFELIGQNAKRKTCEAIKGLISEGEEILEAEGEPAVRDAGIIAAAQRIEHYEMAGYGSARSFAEKLGHAGVVKLLQETLDEEGDADKTLTNIAEKVVNAQALKA